MAEVVPVHVWVFPARLVRVVDADTLDVEIDQGMHSRRLERVRLLGLNAPEPKGATRAAGDAATDWARIWLAQRSQMLTPSFDLVIQTFKSDVFGRYLARVWAVKDGACLNDDILAAGHAVVDIRG